MVEQSNNSVTEIMNLANLNPSKYPDSFPFDFSRYTIKDDENRRVFP